MPDYPHFTQHKTLTGAIIGFGQAARINGLNVGIQESLDVLEAAKCGVMDDPKTFRYALKSIFCCSEEDEEVFEKIFDWYWGAEKGALKSRTTFKNQSNLQKKSQPSAAMVGKAHGEDEGEKESKNVSGANAIERLRKTDFSKVTEIESQYLEELAMRLWKQMSLRLKRKMKTSKTKGQIDLRQTIRSCIGHGGDPIDLRKRDRKRRKQRLVILLDVSDSMDKYSFFLLRFLCALRAHFEKIEAFIFSTSLIRITDYLDSKNLGLTLAMLSSQADNWSGGTKIGACLQGFNENFAKRVLNGHSTTIVLSDGLDTGEPELLAAEMKKIHLRTRQLIWLNPLKGMSGYEPVQRGMSVALPEVDVFKSAHSLDSILELENFLFNV